MRRSRFTKRQIVSILEEAEAGAAVKEISRRHGIIDATYYNWKARYGGMSAAELKRLMALESELSQYKKMYAELAQESYALNELIEKIPGPSAKHEAARYLVARHGLSRTHACAAVKLLRSGWYRPATSRQAADRAGIEVLSALVEKHPRWGFWMCYVRLSLQGYRWNHKRVYRVYEAMKLNLPRRRMRRLPKRDQVLMAVEARANSKWQWTSCPTRCITVVAFAR